MAEAADRMFDGLPAVFRSRDVTGELGHLLDVLGAFFFTGITADEPGLEQYLAQIPTLFLPLPTDGERGLTGLTPDAFLPWLASFLSFTPFPLFAPASLRRIIAGIVPLYGRRGTEGYLVRLLELCFGDEVTRIDVNDRPQVGLTVGESALGINSRLAVSRPFSFKVAIGLHEAPASEALQHRVRAVIDFAKPAHTIYELEWRTHPRGKH